MSNGSLRQSWASTSQNVLLSAPAVLAMAILFLAPALTFLTDSLTGAVYTFSAELPFTLTNVTRLVADSTTRTLAENSLIVGAAAATVCVVVAVPVAYWLRYHAGRWQRPLLALIVLTFFTSYLVRIYAWRTILGEKGVLNDVLTRIGIVDEPLNVFLYNRLRGNPRDRPHPAADRRADHLRWPAAAGPALPRVRQRPRRRRLRPLAAGDPSAARGADRLGRDARLRNRIGRLRDAAVARWPGPGDARRRDPEPAQGASATTLPAPRCR